jgi:hypothetical protein
MFIDFDEVRDFALSFVDKIVESGYIPSDIDTEQENEFDIQDKLIEHFLEKFKVDVCIIPNDGEAYEIEDINEDYMVAFIGSDGVPLGIFKIYTDEDFDEPRLYVCVNHNVVYLDEQQCDKHK